MRRGTVVDGVWTEEYDSAAGTYTRRSADGKVITQRPLTPDEATELTQTVNEDSLLGTLGGSGVFDALRAVAGGTGQFGTAAARDAAIRTCARALVILIRLSLRRLDATD